MLTHNLQTTKGSSTKGAAGSEENWKSTGLCPTLQPLCLQRWIVGTAYETSYSPPWTYSVEYFVTRMRLRNTLAVLCIYLLVQVKVSRNVLCVHVRVWGMGVGLRPLPVVYLVWDIWELHSTKQRCELVGVLLGQTETTDLLRQKCWGGGLRWNWGGATPRNHRLP